LQIAHRKSHAPPRTFRPMVAMQKAGSLFRRYGKFCVVGGTGVLVDMAVLGLIAGLLGWNLSLAKVLAAETAIVNNYTWNDRWTFRGRSGRGWGGWLAGLGRFNLICLAGIGWSVLLLNAGVNGLGLNIYLANGIAIRAGEPVEFLDERAVRMEARWSDWPLTGRRLRPDLVWYENLQYAIRQDAPFTTRGGSGGRDRDYPGQSGETHGPVDAHSAGQFAAQAGRLEG